MPAMNLNSSSRMMHHRTTPLPVEWYCPETGVYQSRHPTRFLPTDPFLDVVSFIFSHNHRNGGFVDSSTGTAIPRSEIYPLIKSVASGLHHQFGVRQGDVVLILLQNSVLFPVIFLAILYIGAIVTPMNPLSSLKEIKRQTSDSNVSMAFTSPEHVKKFESLGIPAIGVPEDLEFDSNQSGLYDFSKLISAKSDLAPKPNIHQEDTAAIMYSSGTTGTSKGVVLTHRNFIAVIELFVKFEASQYEYSSSENVYLAVLPMFHIYGLSLFVMGLLSLGSSIVVMRRFDGDEMVKVIERYKITHFPIVPPLLRQLANKAKSVPGSCWKSLKQVSSGAAPLSLKNIEEFLLALPHVDFIQGYGMTESAAVGTRGLNTEKLRKYSSVGLLAPNMEAKVIDWATGAFLPPGGSGELWLRGPGVMKGYLNNGEATLKTIDIDGWLHTGDIACFDKDGYVQLLDRMKEIIKYKGFQIAPAELEEILISHPDIVDAAVTAGYDEEAGEIPIAYIVGRDGNKLSEETVVDFVSKQVAPYKKPRRVVFRKSIPRSAAGKILRRELKNLFSSKL